jgi:hypothetical protein
MEGLGGDERWSSIQADISEGMVTIITNLNHIDGPAQAPTLLHIPTPIRSERGFIHKDNYQSLSPPSSIAQTHRICQTNMFPHPIASEGFQPATDLLFSGWHSTCTYHIYILFFSDPSSKLGVGEFPKRSRVLI